jgi:hypothetical protein
MFKHPMSDLPCGGPTRIGLILGVLFVLVGCQPATDSVVTQSATPVSSVRAGERRFMTPDGRAITKEATERALNTIGRAIAMSLRDSSTRAVFAIELESSPFRERKVSLQALLGPRTNILTRVALGSGAGEAALRSALDSMVSVEVYMPIPGQLARWRGTRSVQVAVQLGRRDAIFGYGLDGTVSRLSPVVAPSTPTIVLTESETDFTRSPLIEAHQQVDCEEYPELCSGGGGSGGGGGQSQPPGLYATYIQLDDLHEPWTRGSPEIEIHVMAGDSTAGASAISCAGEKQPDLNRGTQRFNMDDHTWTGDVLVLGAAKADSVILARGVDTLNTMLSLWEDDDTPCVIKTDVNTFGNFLSAFGNFSMSSILTLYAIGEGGLGNGFVAATVFVALPWNFFRMLDSLFGWGNDDPVGVVVDATTWNSQHGDNVSTTHAIILNGVRVGQIDLVVRQ